MEVQNEGFQRNGGKSAIDDGEAAAPLKASEKGIPSPPPPFNINSKPKATSQINPELVYSRATSGKSTIDDFGNLKAVKVETVETDTRGKKGKKLVGKELKNLLGGSPDPMFIEDSIKDTGVAERVVGRRRKSVVKRIVEAQERKAGKKKVSEDGPIVIESDGEEGRSSRKGGVDLSFLEDYGDEEDVKESPEVVAERELARKKRREWAEANPNTLERVLQLGNSSGLLSVDENNEHLREVIKGVIDDAVRFGLDLDAVEIPDEEKLRRMEEEEGKFEWEEEESSDHDRDMASRDVDVEDDSQQV